MEPSFPPQRAAPRKYPQMAKSKIREVEDCGDEQETTVAIAPVQRSIVDLKPGLHTLPMLDYIALPAFSSGMAHTLLTECPAVAWFDSPFNPKRPKDESKVADIGTLMHDLLLGGEGLIDVIDPADYPAKNGNIPDGWTNNAIREARDASYAAGRTPVFQAAYDEAVKAVSVAKAYIAETEIADAFESGKAEQTIIWQDGDVLCKARPDYLTDEIILHVKTTKASVHPSSFSRLAINMGYDISIAFYERGLARLSNGKTRDSFILAIEQDAPFACKFFSLSAASADIASRAVERAISLWARCAHKNNWPAYDGSTHVIEPTPWAMAEAEAAAFTEDELKGGIPL